MDTWTRLTNLRVEGRGGLEKISQRTFMHISAVQEYRQWCGEGQQVGKDRGWVEGGEGRGDGDFCNSVNNKNIFKFDMSEDYQWW